MSNFDLSTYEGAATEYCKYPYANRDIGAKSFQEDDGSYNTCYLKNNHTMYYSQKTNVTLLADYGLEVVMSLIGIRDATLVQKIFAFYVTAKGGYQLAKDWNAEIVHLEDNFHKVAYINDEPRYNAGVTRKYKIVLGDSSKWTFAPEPYYTSIDYDYVDNYAIMDRAISNYRYGY